VVASTLDVIGLMCEHAGGFIRSRIESAWDVLKKVHRRTQERTSANSKAGSSRQLLQGGLKLGEVETGIAKLNIGPSMTEKDVYRPEMYTSTPSRMIWDSLVNCLCAIAQAVALRDEQFEELLDILDPVLTRPDVKTALDKANADSVWLRLYKKERSASQSKALNTPVGKARWNFVKV
jgi:hypothetical protein